MRTTITRALFILALVPLLALALACSGGSHGSPAAPTPVIANYAGAWTGTYLVSGCTQSGGLALANICGSTLGRTLPYRLTLTQSGSNVSGTFLLGAVSFPSTGGTVGSDGSLTLSGSDTSNGVTVIATWTLRLNGTALSGNLTQVWTSTSLSGQTTLVGTVVTSTR